MNNKALIAVAVLIAAGIVAGDWFAATHGNSTIVKEVFGNPAGATFAQQALALQEVTTATNTVYAMLNTDGSDRAITGAVVSLSGQTSTSTTQTIACSTSTVASGFPVANTNYILNMRFDALGTQFGTTTGTSTSFVATSSPGLTGTSSPQSLVGGWLGGTSTKNFIRNWQAGSWLVCQVSTGDSYNLLNTGSAGFIGFNYIDY